MGVRAVVFALLWTGASRGEESVYAGSRACAPCHQRLHARQNASHHAQSLRPPSEIAELTAALPFRFEGGGESLLLERGSEGALSLSAGSSHVLLEWAFGSGAKGITPVGRTADGQFREGRLSWYKSSGGFALTPGATRFEQKTDADRLGRTLTANEAKECFGCHTTGYAPDRPAPARHEMGIRCESCHGPAAAHVAAMSKPTRTDDLRIVHPARLDAAGQVRLCGTCHGRVPSDTDLAAIRAIEANPNTARFPSTRLVLSRCYNESAEGLKCSGCHDAHGDTSQDRSRFDAACLSCHTCPKASRSCSDCHMPKERIMVQSEFTDHWIRVVRARRP